eukprot:4220964-Pyramimonas_sp.AAC.1
MRGSFGPDLARRAFIGVKVVLERAGSEAPIENENEEEEKEERCEAAAWVMGSRTEVQPQPVDFDDHHSACRTPFRRAAACALRIRRGSLRLLASRSQLKQT